MLHIEKFNPLFLYMDIARTAVIGNAISHPSEQLAAALMALGSFFVGRLFFTRMEGSFAYHF